MNFHRNTNSDKRSTRVTHHAKAPSAGSTQATGSSRGPLRRALATRGARNGSKGSGAPSPRRLRATLAVLALAIAAFAITAAPASAAPEAAKVETISAVSYTSAHVTGKVSSPGCGSQFCFGFSYSIQYSTDPFDETSWQTGFTETLGGAADEKPVGGNISVPKGGTKYFVRLKVDTIAGASATSPNPTPISPPSPSTRRSSSPPTTPPRSSPSRPRSPAKSNAPPTSTPIPPSTSPPAASNTSPTTTSKPPALPARPKQTARASTPITDPNGKQKVSAHLSGLEPSTTYHLRLAAENAAPDAATKDAADTFTSAAKVAPPTVISVAGATDIGTRTAKVSGEVQRPAGEDPALDTNCRFEFVSDAQFTQNEAESLPPFEGAIPADCQANPVQAGDLPEVKAQVGGLAPDTEYHYRLVAENAGGTDSKEAASTFTTVALIPPTLTVDSITEVGYLKAHVSTTFSGGNQGIIGLGIEYAPVGTEDWSVIGGRFPDGGGQISTEIPCLTPPYEAVCGPPLLPGTTYKLRLSATAADDGSQVFSSEPFPEFTTKGTSTPPTATLNPVTAVTGTTAHFSGTVDTKAPAEALDAEGKAAYDTDWHFECTPACGNPSGTCRLAKAAKPSPSMSKTSKPTRPTKSS